jgi:hypothetical protein
MPIRLVSAPAAKPWSTIFWKVRGISSVVSDEPTSATIATSS